MSSTQIALKTNAINSLKILPSILEGNFLYSSLYQPKQGNVIIKTAPVLLNAPLITGDNIIPAVLSCSTGVWSASPSPVYTYKWFADTIEIPTETNSTLITDLSLFEKVITCEVTATNSAGAAFSLSSNSITMAALEDFILSEFNFLTITGLPFDDTETVYSLEVAIIQGTAKEGMFELTDTNIYIIEFVEYIGYGFSYGFGYGQ